MRVVKVRTGVALDRSAGALARMLLPFRLGLGGPIASGRQYLPWIALEDLLGIYLAALYQPDWSGPVNACGPEPARSRDFARALGRAVHRPAMVPVPVFALRILFGEVATVLAGGQRMNPRRPLDWGYEFKYPELAAALQAALSSQ
jgi:uncharacterized protein (TIGR01777 family)